MNILFTTPYPPSRIRMRAYFFIRALRARGHTVTVVTPWSGAGEAADVARLAGEAGVGDPAGDADDVAQSAAAADPAAAGDGPPAGIVAAPLTRARRLANLLAAVPAGVPLQARYAWQPALLAAAVAEVERAARSGRPYDVAHVEHLRASMYALGLRSRLPVVWDSVDCITDLFEQARAHTTSRRGRLMTALDLGRTRRHEGWLARQFDATVVTSHADRRALESLAATSAGPPKSPAPVDVVPIDVVPNGVDLDFFRPAAVAGRDPATVLFSGKLSYHANVTAARHLVDDIMPVVWAARPDARVVLAGAEPARDVRALAGRHPGRVDVTGPVPDLRPYLHCATVAAAPMVYAVGIQNKILEAMATAAPVVTTPIAARALAAHSGRDLLVADTPADFAAALLALLGDPARAAALGAAGRAFVERHHTWDAAAAGLESAYEAAIARSRSRGGPD